MNRLETLDYVLFAVMGLALIVVPGSLALNGRVAEGVIVAGLIGLFGYARLTLIQANAAVQAMLARSIAATPAPATEAPPTEAITHADIRPAKTAVPDGREGFIVHWRTASRHGEFLLWVGQLGCLFVDPEPADRKFLHRVFDELLDAGRPATE